MPQTIALKKIFLADIAEWLRTQPETWWIVDGDDRLDRKIGMPAREHELAEMIDRVRDENEQLDVVLPEEDAALGNTGLERLFSRGGEGYGRSLQAEGGTDGCGWALVEETQFVNEALEDLLDTTKKN